MPRLQASADAPRRSRTPWRAFDTRDTRQIDEQVQAEQCPCCPRCQGVLEARPETRMERHLVLDAIGYDLECRGCRRFRPVIQHTERSLRLLRMRRLAAAVRACDGAKVGAAEMAVA